MRKCSWLRTTKGNGKAMDLFVEKEIPSLNKDLNRVLRLQGLPEAKNIFAPSKKDNILLGSDLFESQDELHAVFPDNLYGLNPEGERLHTALGKPGFFTTGIISTYLNSDASGKDSFALRELGYGCTITPRKVIEFALRKKFEETIAALLNDDCNGEYEFSKIMAVSDFLNASRKDDVDEKPCAPSPFERGRQEEIPPIPRHPVFQSSTSQKQKADFLNDPLEIKEIIKQLRDM